MCAFISLGDAYMDLIERRPIALLGKTSVYL